MSYIKPRARRGLTRWALSKFSRLGRRKGVTIVEAVILMVVIIIAFGAVFQTIYWTQRTYAFNRQDRDSREVLFKWAETFESVWPPDDAFKTPGSLLTKAKDCVETVGNLLGVYSDDVEVARVGGFNVTVADITAPPDGGRIDLVITIETPNRQFVRSLTRSYNIYSNAPPPDTVSADTAP